MKRDTINIHDYSEIATGALDTALRYMSDFHVAIDEHGPVSALGDLLSVAHIYATIATAQAAERQAVALERIVELLEGAVDGHREAYDHLQFMKAHME